MESDSSSSCSSDSEVEELVRSVGERLKTKIAQFERRKNGYNKKSLCDNEDRSSKTHHSRVDPAVDSESDSEEETSTETKNKIRQLNSEAAQTLSSSIKSDIDLNTESYVKMTPKTQKQKGGKLASGLTSDSELMKKSVLTPEIESKDVLLPYDESVRQKKKARRLERNKTKGKHWFDFKAPEVTEEMKNDLNVLHMRKILDPKRFYKSNDRKSLPKFFQFGKVIESPADFYHSRVPKKQRKPTMVDELLADAEFRKFNKRKYLEIQEAKRKAQGPYGPVKIPKKIKK